MNLGLPSKDYSQFEMNAAKFVRDISDEVKIDEISSYYLSLPLLKDHYAELKGLHHACWSILNQPKLVKGYVVCDSMVTFTLCALAEETVDDRRTIRDFPLITIHDCWSHDDFNEVPITRLSMQVVVDLLFGLEWFLLSDLFTPIRSDEVIHQARNMFALIRSRICFFIKSDNLCDEVLDIKEYRIVAKKGLFAAVSTADLDYDSDDETFGKKKARLETDLSIHDLNISYVNKAFVFDMDSIITGFEKEWYLYDTLKVQNSPDSSRILLSNFRSFVFDSVSKLSQSETLKARRFWQENLEMLPSYERMFIRKRGFIVKKIPRQIIMMKNDKLCEIGECKSFLDITTRQVGKHADIGLRLSSDAMFVHLSEQKSKMCSILMAKGVIYRDRIRNGWIVNYKGERTIQPSFTHAFVYLRSLMDGVTVFYDVDISMYDQKF